MTESPRVAVVGAGNMGANHARVVAASPRAELAMVLDVDADRADAVARPLGVEGSTDLAAAAGCDAVVVAATTEVHLDIALPLLEAGVSCLVEKPLADDLVAVDRLIGASETSGAALMCGFVERFNPAVVGARALLDGSPVHLLGIRHSPHNPRTRSSVIDDLLIHDIDLALDLLGGSVTSVSGGHWVSPDGVEELADCTMVFDHGAVATLSSSRTSQRKVRSLSLSSVDLLIEIDLLRHDLTAYRHRSGEVVDRDGPIYRAETVVEIPFVRHTGEPLAVQFDHFVDLVTSDASRDAERASLRAPHAAVAQIKAGVR